MSRMTWAVVIGSSFLVACEWAAAPAASTVRGREPILGLPCEGCEEVFNGLPPVPASISRIAPLEEPGEALRLEGTVVDGDGRPAKDVIVYAYHTDAHGIYPKDERPQGSKASRHGRLRAWVKTDTAGRYQFDSIRPASYPDSTIPSHIHMHVIEVGRCTYWIDDVMFDDDPHLTSKERGRQRGRGGNGIVVPRRDEGGTWVAVRDIRLGERVPGYR